MVNIPGIHLRHPVARDEPALRQVVTAAYAGYATQGIELPSVADGLGADIRDRIAGWLSMAIRSRAV